MMSIKAIAASIFLLGMGIYGLVGMFKGPQEGIDNGIQSVVCLIILVILFGTEVFDVDGNLPLKKKRYEIVWFLLLLPGIVAFFTKIPKRLKVISCIAYIGVIIYYIFRCIAYL